MIRRLSLAIGAALLGASSTALGITDIETNSSVPFSFLNPGARSLGMGSAFVGLADDATAAYTNPAGLTQLVQPEFSIEGRHTNISEAYVNGGSATLDPFDLSRLNHSDAKSSKTNPSFIAFVWPHDNFALAFYRHEVSRFSTKLQSSGADLADDPTQPGVINEVLLPFNGSTNLRIVNYSTAAALKLNDVLSVGVGVSYYTFNYSATRDQFDNVSFAPPIVSGTVSDSGSDHALGATFGLRARFNDQWSAGFAYRLTPQFSYRETSTFFEGTDASGNPVLIPGGFPPTQLDNVHLKVPEVYSLGVSYRPMEPLVINFDIDYVRYAQITDHMQSSFSFSDPTTSLDRLRIPNGTELHLGGEYTFGNMAHPLSLRAGVWRDPRHTISFDGTPVDSDGLVEAADFAGGAGGKMHYSAGLGMAFKTFQIDAAADISSKIDTYSISAIYRF